MTGAVPAVPKPRCSWEPHLRDAGHRSKDRSAGSFLAPDLQSGDQGYCRRPLL